MPTELVMSNTTNDNPQGNEPEIDILDLEDHSKSNGGKPPKARHYRIRVDREKFTVEVPGMFGKDILILAGKTPPGQYLLNQKFRHGQVIAIGQDQFVDFTAPGVERFTTLPKDQTEGREQRRQLFQLPEEDVLQLDATGYDWETIEDHWLLVHHFPIPAGYNIPEAQVAIQITPGYPTAALDMAYFHPQLQLSSGRSVPNAQSHQNIDGKPFQRWSRHYTPQHPWVPGEYNILSHLLLVRTWLDRELTRN
jgi:hypothetical protein